MESSEWKGVGIVGGMMDEDQRKALKSLLLKHRKCVYANYGAGDWGYACLCGERLRSNSHHALAEHQSEVVAFWVDGEVR